MRGNKIVICLLIASFFTGCATFNKVVMNNELASQLAVEAATARVLHEHPEWTGKVVSITAGAIDAIDAKTLIDLASVQGYIQSKIPWDKVTPEEQALIAVLLQQVTQNITDNLRAQNVKRPELQMIAVRQTLQWINETARRNPA